MPEVELYGSAVPGTVVSSGSLVTPGGDAGVNAFNLTSGSFTVPAVGSTVNVTLNDASWVVVGQFVYVDQAGGGVGQAGLMQVTAKTGNQLTLLNPTIPPAIPLADNTQSGLLRQVSNAATDYVDGTNHCQNLVTAIQPTIWSVRLRSFNALGNPNFEVDQRTCGTGVGYGVGGTAPFCMDRWQASKVGATGTATAVQTLGATNVPGTSFAIGGWFLRTTVTATQASLAAGDLLWLNQNIEGPLLRELINDVHSVSILCRSSVANLKFGLALRDGGATRSLLKLCSLGAANTWTLITLPNIPIWAAGGGWTFASGQVGYQLSITLAAGTTYTAAANDTWQSANVLGAVGQSNFLANASATFDIAFVQHEPGSQCSTLIDCPFTQNYDDCLRYYTKSYPYGVAPGTATYAGNILFINPTSSTQIYCNMPFKRTMAKTPPTITFYSTATGTANTIRNVSTGADISAGTGGLYPGDAACGGLAVTVAPAAGSALNWHYTADTGW
jgi:hypothetical protein